MGNDPDKAMGKFLNRMVLVIVIVAVLFFIWAKGNSE